jgi:uncharacterized membrane protein YdbT with pleckstrin-like domain
MARPRPLLQEEEVVYDARPHPLYFSLQAWWSLPVLVAAYVFMQVSGFAATVLHAVVLYGGLVWSAWAAWKVLQWYYTRFTVTTYRVIHRRGVIARDGVEIPLERVSNVNFHQSVSERIFGAGDLVIESSGADGQSRFTDIRHPDDVQMLIHAQIARPAAAQAAPTQSVHTATQPDSQADLFRRLDDLRARGILSDEEFATAVRKLLGS